MHFLRHNSIRSCLALLLFVATIAPGNAWVHWFLSCAEPDHHAHCFLGFFGQTNHSHANHGHANHSHGHAQQGCCHPVNWSDTEIDPAGRDACAANTCAANSCTANSCTTNTSAGDSAASCDAVGRENRTGCSVAERIVSTEQSPTPCAATMPAVHSVELLSESSHALGVECPICSLFAKALQVNLTVLAQANELVVSWTAPKLKFFQLDSAYGYLARGPPSFVS